MHLGSIASYGICTELSAMKELTRHEQRSNSHRQFRFCFFLLFQSQAGMLVSGDVAWAVGLAAVLLMDMHAARSAQRTTRPCATAAC